MPCNCRVVAVVASCMHLQSLHGLSLMDRGDAQLELLGAISGMCMHPALLIPAGLCVRHTGLKRVLWMFWDG